MLPDRERRHLLQFHAWPSLTYGPRLLLAFGLLAAGLLVQVLLYSVSPEAATAVGAILLLAGNSLLLIKGYDLQPRRARRKGVEWERTTLDQFAEFRRREIAVDRWDRSLTDISCGSGFAVLLFLVLVPAALVFLALGGLEDEPAFAILFAVDAVVLLLPHWLTGLRLKWKPVGLHERIACLVAAVDAIERYETPPCQVQAMFLMAEGSEGRVPVDARVFVRFPDGPETFLGLQFQVAINNVQGTRYPYFYGVLVAREEFGLIDGHEREVEAGTAFKVETSRDGDEGVEAIVIRQRTTKDSGYHTTRHTVAKIAREAWTAAARLVGTPARRS